MSDFVALGNAMYDFVGRIVLQGGGAAMVAYLAFRAFAERWLQSKFDEKLEAYRHENAKEISRMRVAIDGALDATVRLQEKEFKAIAECWEKINIAYGAVSDLVNPIQEYQNIDKMSHEAVLEYIDQIDLFKFQKLEIIKSENKADDLSKFIKLNKLNYANKSINYLQNTTTVSEIFIDHGLYSAINEITQLMRKCIAIHKKSMRTDLEDKSWDILTNDVLTKIHSLSHDTRNKFFTRDFS